MHQNENLNLIYKYLQGLEVSKTRHIELFLQTFYSGRAANLTEEEMEIIQSYATRWVKDMVMEMVRLTVLCCREKIVKKLMLHWHLISDTNSTDRSELRANLHSFLVSDF